VHLAGAEQLPFPDDHFDFVYSVHALEHIPSDMKDRAFAELKRVCTGTQFHMLPMIGHGNYVGERTAVVKALMKDPSHTLIEDRNWWLRQFDKIGFGDTASYIFFENDPNADLGDSQIIVSRVSENTDLLRKARSWNIEVLQRLLNRAEYFRGGIFQPANAIVAPSKLVEGRTGWRDVELELRSIRATRDTHFLLRVELQGESAGLRLCILTANGGEADAWLTFHPGVTTVQLKIEDFVVRKSPIINESIHKILFGGETNSKVSVEAAAFIKTK
jgi:SAM-dependent methyltransferase